MNDRIHVGLPEPADHGTRQPSCDEMRQAIARGRRDSVLIHHTLMYADHAGLSGEDKYVVLAYHALIQLEGCSQRLMRVLQLSSNSSAFLQEKP